MHTYIHTYTHLHIYTYLKYSTLRRSSQRKFRCMCSPLSRVCPPLACMCPRQACVCPPTPGTGTALEIKHMQGLRV